MSAGDNHATVRLLAVLVMTPDDQLLEFKRRCLDATSAVNAKQLGAAKEMLLALSAALKDGDEDAWNRIVHARDVLRPRAREQAPQLDRVGYMPAGAVPPGMPPAQPARPVAPAPMAPAPAPAPFVAPAPPPPEPPSSAPESVGGETVGLMEKSPVAGLALPFSGRANAPPPSTAGEEDSFDSGETAFFGSESPVAGLAIPFERPTPPSHRAPELTLEQYASLCASCEADPSSTATIEAQYGVRHPDQRRALDAQWHAHLADNLAERARFEQLLSQYRNWVRNQGR